MAATVLLQKTLTRTDLAASAAKNVRIALGKAQVRAALRGLLEVAAAQQQTGGCGGSSGGCGLGDERDDISNADQALEALTAVPLVRLL